MGITTVPLPAFWSSPKEGDHLRCSPRKEHHCQNLRCAANSLACSTPHKEPPPRRVKRPSKNLTTNNMYPVSSTNTRAELEHSGGVKARHIDHSGKSGECKVAPSRRSVAKQESKLRESYSVKSYKASTRINSRDSSKSSTTPISFTSHATSISTPIRFPPKPSKIGLATLSDQKESSSTTRSSSPALSGRATQSRPTSCFSDCIMDRYIDDENLASAFLRGKGMDPPNSEKDEEEVPPSVELLDRQLNPKFLSTMPRFNELLISPLSTSLPAPSLPTDHDQVMEPKDLVHSTSSSSSTLPPKPLACVAPAMPPEAKTNGIQATPVCCSSQLTVSKSSESASGSIFRRPDIGNGIPTIQHVRCRTPAIPKSMESNVSTRSSTKTTMGNASESSGFIFRRPDIVDDIATIQNVMCRTPAIPKSMESNVSTRSSTQTTTGNAAQMCILEQRLEDEDRKSSSSNLTSSGSDSPKDACSVEVNSAFCGGKPVSAFYNALYAPDCTLSGTKALEAHLQRRRRSADARIRVALEIALFSAMITLLVVVFHPAITRGLRSQLHGCCPCPVESAIRVSRNTGQHYSTFKSPSGCVYKGVRNLLKCPSAQQTVGSTVVK